MSSSRVVRVRTAKDGATPQVLRDGIAEIQRELEVSPEFPAEVEAAAEKAVANPRLPDLDRTDLPLVTIDPAGAKDLIGTPLAAAQEIAARCREAAGKALGRALAALERIPPSPARQDLVRLSERLAGN